MDETVIFSANAFLGGYSLYPHQHRTERERVQGWVNSVVYRPNWRIYLREPSLFETGAPVVGVEATVEDSYHPGRHVRLGMARMVPEYVETFEQFIRWLEEVLDEGDKHERAEWLRDAITRKPIHDPHAKAQ
jgi:hypothetical protein